jgi:hypothetical protein
MMVDGLLVGIRPFRVEFLYFIMLDNLLESRIRTLFYEVSPTHSYIPLPTSPLQLSNQFAPPNIYHIIYLTPHKPNHL